MAEGIPTIIWRALALVALLGTAMAPAAVLSAEGGRSGPGTPRFSSDQRAGSSKPTPPAGVAAPQSTPAPDPWPPGSSAALGPSGSGPAPGCDAQSIVAGRALAGGTDCVAPDLERDQAYLVETASPGGTMLRQGSALAITRLHPVFVRRLAGAIHEARDAGLPSARIFSAYRPPAFGVGGFADKFNSLHSYGLAVDMLGIGGPASSEAKLWHEIAARHGIVCPYGADNRREWNHCQPTRVKIIPASNPLRGTVSPQGPFDLEVMFAVGDALVSGYGAGSPEQQPASDQVGIGRAGRQPQPQGSAGRGHDNTDRTHERHTPGKPIAGSVASRHLHDADGHPNLRIMREISVRHNPQAAPSRCPHLHNHRRDMCGVLAETAFGKEPISEKISNLKFVQARESRALDNIHAAQSVADGSEIQ